MKIRTDYFKSVWRDGTGRVDLLPSVSLVKSVHDTSCFWLMCSFLVFHLTIEVEV